jgi:hypothetical protein
MTVDLEAIRSRQLRLMTGYCDDRAAADISTLIAEVEKLRKELAEHRASLKAKMEVVE